MKKTIEYVILLVCTALCISGCFANGTSCENDSVETNTMYYSEENPNSVLASFPIFIDNGVLYYADGGKKMIKKENNSITTIDNCDTDLIQDLYVYNKELYYTKHTSENIKIMKYDGTNSQELLAIPNQSALPHANADDFIYVTENMLYYHHSYHKVLYLINHNGSIQKTIEGITAVSIGENNNYYADTNGSVYVCDKNFENSEEIWNLQRLAEKEDEFLSWWCEMNLEGNPVIRQMSVNNNELFFAVFAHAQIRNGLLISIGLDNGELSYVEDVSLENYQMINNNIYISGACVIDQQEYRGLIQYDIDTEVITGLGIKKKNFFISGSDCYFLNDVSNYSELIKLDLNTRETENVA